MVVKRIELIVCAYLGGWERRLSAYHVSRALSVTREHASRKVMVWAKEAFHLSAPEGSRRTVFIEEGLEALPQGLRTPRELMTHLPGIALVCGEELGAPEIVRLSDYLSAEGEPDIFHALYAAMRRREALLLTYRAKSGDLSLWFSAHSLVDTQHRSHFRGHARWVRDGDCAFIDLVPSRVLVVEGRSPEAYTGSAEDTAWQTKTDLMLELSEELPEEIRSVVIQEWGHQLRQKEGRMVLKLGGLRQPLVQYVKDAICWRTFLGARYEVWREYS